ncbi:MAG: HNH endonuclease [Proteobacteria bacterium]|nr:HNH endonuclease [Pseudomonadota bacterium]
MTSQIVKNRLKAFKNQAGRCYYCESIMWLDKKEDFAADHKIGISEAEKLKCTAEHLIARCDGGKNNQSNIVAACLLCNSERHRLRQPPAPTQYRELIKKRLKKGNWHPKSLLLRVSQHV